MTGTSGTAVVVDDLPNVNAVQSEPDSLDRLITYLGTRFTEQDQRLVELTRAAASLKLKQDVVSLGFAAIEFRRELSSWIELAVVVRKELWKTQFEQSYEEELLSAQSSDLKRPDSTLVKAKAEASIASIVEAEKRLTSARSEMESLVTWCQTLQNTVRSEEFGDAFEDGNDAPDGFFHAPLSGGLNLLTRRG